MSINSYLLLDGAQIDQLAAQLYSLEDSPSLHLLYQRTAYAELADVGPLLVRVKPHTPLAAHFNTQWQHSAGIWLESDADEMGLVEHLRSLVHLRTEGDVSLLFRYYDPRILYPWLAELEPGVRDTLMGPIKRVRLQDESGQEQIIERQTLHTFARYDDKPWLSLSLAQLHDMSQGRYRAFDQRLLAHVEEHFPQALEGRDTDARCQWARTCRESAASHGYGSADEVSRWAGLMARLGTDFPQGANHQPYRDKLLQPGSPAQRLDSLIHLLQSQLLADKEVTP